MKKRWIHPIWSVNNGRRIVRSVMTENRFKNLLRFCRFDETTNTKAAQTDEKAEADFQPPNTNAIHAIQTGKYWITIFWYCDAETSCPLAEEIDVGRQPGQKARMDVADLVKRIPLAEDLLSKKTTIVGTLRKNRKEAPSAK
ncbi:hypothetical protein T12_2390 [Trichinella patagoniensis]|uniref:PiggyBac transposable element-derived protein domain-containing protein n=1 Tax=Trichinella patagoniensis TaxID=990121 RepID=A0A0V0ZAZ9_9BILA|nr:hypothetical protein T12_2390 [Trichinella patagoniensis]